MKAQIPEHPELLVIHADERSKRVAGEDWHSDVTCDGGDALFASMYAAYDALSEPMKTMLDGLTAIHDGEHVYRGRYGYDDSGRTYPKSEHPEVRTHPVTRRKALFVNRGFTTRIKQLKRAESDAVLEMLYRHIETPEFHCRFQWRPNSIAFRDNRCAQHHAVWDYCPNRRHGYRVTIRGDRPS